MCVYVASLFQHVVDLALRDSSVSSAG